MAFKRTSRVNIYVKTENGKSLKRKQVIVVNCLICLVFA